jgi:hypothetical protein
VYAGDSNFDGSRSNVVRQLVNKDPTTTVLISSLNPSTYGQPVTWTATVTPNEWIVPIDPPTGRVHFGGIGYATLNQGVATLTRSGLAAGEYGVTAEYQGDRNYAPSASTTLNQMVNPASTTTTIVSSANPSSQGQIVTFTAKVSSLTGARATGTVTFTAGETVLGIVPLNGITAKIATSTLPVGSTTVTATYSGAENFVGSSASLTQTVNKRAGGPLLRGDCNPSRSLELLKSENLGVRHFSRLSRSALPHRQQSQASAGGAGGPLLGVFVNPDRFRSAIHPRSVSWFIDAYLGLRCHP